MSPTVFNKTVLPNGIQVLTECHPESNCVTLGMTFGIGSRSETLDQAGICHFIEHMVFKGTQSRNAFQIVSDLEAVGGEINAFTSRESTSFHSVTLTEDWRLAADVLFELCFAATFPDHEIQREQSVVLHEIASCQDNLEEFVFDEFTEMFYGEHPLGRQILGRPESIATFGRDKILDFYRKEYIPSRLIIAAAGNIEHKELVSEIERLCSGLAISQGSPQLVNNQIPNPVVFDKRLHSRSEQAHLVLGLPVEGFNGKYRFESYLLHTLLGGGMTSRLYQKIREERGLCYSVFTQLQSFVDTGVLYIYAGTDVEKLGEVVGLIKSEIDEIYKNGISAKDLDFYRRQLRGNILIASEDIENRMNSMTVNEMVFGRYRSVEDVIHEIEQVTVESCAEFAKKYFKSELLSSLVVGPFADLATDE